MLRIASPSPKKRPIPPNDAAKAVKDSAVKDTGRSARVAETVRKAAKEEPVARKPKTTRRRKRKEGDWTYNEEDKCYILEPRRQDVHKFTWIYLHYLCGHPKEYF